MTAPKKSNFDLIKANLNLYAVLQNIEDLVKYDKNASKIVKKWDISIQFSVLKGPKSYLVFKDGGCRFGKGKMKRPDVKLFFMSPGHLNRMMDGKANPIPLKGITKLGFLTKEFPKVTDRLEYFLKPTDKLLKNRDYLAMNTRLTLNTAAFAAKEIAELDERGKIISSHINDGTVVIRVGDGEPAVSINVKNGIMAPGKGDSEKPMAVITMKNLKVANDFLNGKSDSFAEIASGNVVIKGQIPMIDSLSLILGRVAEYLS